MKIIIANEVLTCSKCFTSIQPGEPCITDAPLLKYDGNRKELKIRHWHRTRPDHPDSCYEREIRTERRQETAAEDFICAYCEHPIAKGQEIYTEELWITVDEVFEDSEFLTDRDGERILDENGNLLQHQTFSFHKECSRCNSNLSCLHAFASSIVATESDSDEPPELDELESDVDAETIRIAEKVRFWEEQDRINQELIPRVIRQNELLSQHIAEHDNLQQILSDTIQKALTEQAQQYESALNAAQKQLDETHDEITQKTMTKALETLHQEARQTRNRLAVITVVSIAIAALMFAVLT